MKYEEGTKSRITRTQITVRQCMEQRSSNEVCVMSKEKEQDERKTFLVRN